MTEDTSNTTQIDSAQSASQPAKKVAAKKTAAKKAAGKKAAAKKSAAKKTAAKKVVASPAAETTDVAAPVKKAVAKKSAAKKSAAKKAEPAIQDADSRPGDETDSSNRTRRRGGRPGVDFSAAPDDDDARTETADRPAPKGRPAPLAVVFQPPADDAAPTRARRSRPAADAGDDSGADDAANKSASGNTRRDGGPNRTRTRRPAGDAPQSAEADPDADEDDDEAPADGEETAAESAARRRRRRGRRGRGRTRTDGTTEPGAEGDDEAGQAESESAGPTGDEHDDDPDSPAGTRRRRRRRSRSGSGEDGASDDPPNTVVRVRTPRPAQTTGNDDDEVRGIAGSTRMEAKRQRRREGREQGRRRPPILTEAEFLARREAVDRVMVVRQTGDRTQIAVLEDGVLVEHYVTRADAISYVGNVYLGKVQNVLPSMEAAFIDISKGRNGVLYAGEVNYDASQFDGRPHRIESALKPGQSVLVQVTKDPIGHKGARLTSQVSLPGRYLVYVPEGSMTGISRKLPETERNRLKSILKKIVPEDAGVIVRTAAEGASEEELTRDIARLQAQWESISEKAAKATGGATLVYGEPDLVIRVVRDIFNEDFAKLIVSGRNEWELVEQYVETFAPELRERVEHWVNPEDVFAAHRIDEQLVKALDRKVWLPSGGSLVIDRTEAMVVVDVNTGKFVGKGGNLEETVTKNNLEAAEEIVRQLRLRDLGGIIVIDFIDMVLESNRELVLRRLIECLGRDRTKHQVAEVTSLGLVQMTRKRVGQGLLEAFSETCEECNGRGVKVSFDAKVPGAPGNGRTPKQEHRHDKSEGGGEQGSRRRGSGRGDARATDGSSASVAAGVAAVAAASNGAHAHAGDGRSHGASANGNDAGRQDSDGAAPKGDGPHGDGTSDTPRRSRGRRGGANRSGGNRASAAEAAVQSPTDDPGAQADGARPDDSPRIDLPVTLAGDELAIDIDDAAISPRPARRRRKPAGATTDAG